MSQHATRLMAQLSQMLEISPSPYWDLFLVCRDGTLRQNKAMLVVVFPFLRDYASILDTGLDNMTLILPDFTIADIQTALSTHFMVSQTQLAAIPRQESSGTVSSQKPAGKTVACSQCGKIVMKISLSSHKRLHNNIKFNCNVCKKQFARETQLKIHLRKHTGEMPYPCLICNKKFSTRQGQEAHLKICSKEEPLYTCAECNKAFYTEYKLKLHLLVHTGKKEFSCTNCKKLFSRKDNLKAHIDKFCKK